ncbi:hypothetical protein LRK_04005 [Lacticaseibacillus rhamnosus K32]|nr:hypothetical protein LRK_13350 [Lacticaseibacillus rhamnosus K32]KFC37042.1 hypothetical protein LRK_04005 [Lacticaseibacillus rhamnosus K32]
MFFKIFLLLTRHSRASHHAWFKGSFISVGGQATLGPAFKVKAVDITAAGDTFIGALVGNLQPDLSNIIDAATYASIASLFTLQQLVAFSSIPMGDEVRAGLETRS